MMCAAAVVVVLRVVWIFLSTEIFVKIAILNYQPGPDRSITFRHGGPPFVTLEPHRWPPPPAPIGGNSNNNIMSPETYLKSDHVVGDNLQTSSIPCCGHEATGQARAYAMGAYHVSLKRQRLLPVRTVLTRLLFVSCCNARPSAVYRPATRGGRRDRRAQGFVWHYWN